MKKSKKIDKHLHQQEEKSTITKIFGKDSPILGDFSWVMIFSWVGIAVYRMINRWPSQLQLRPELFDVRVIPHAFYGLVLILLLAIQIKVKNKDLDEREYEDMLKATRVAYALSNGVFIIFAVLFLDPIVLDVYFYTTLIFHLVAKRLIMDGLFKERQ